MIKSSSIHFAYNKDKFFDFPDIVCTSDSPCLILGPSGCGKSTLLHLLGGLMKPDQGTIQVAGTDITQLSGTKLDRFRGNRIGIIFQRPHFIRSLNVLENLMVAPFFGGEQVNKTEARKILSELGLGDKAQQSTNTLSQGEQQRLSIARVLINKPTLILADEPTSALDDYNCMEVLRLLQEKAQTANAALVVVTHDGRLKDQIQNQIHLKPPQQ